MTMLCFAPRMLVLARPGSVRIVRDGFHGLRTGEAARRKRGKDMTQKQPNNPFLRGSGWEDDDTLDDAW